MKLNDVFSYRGGVMWGTHLGWFLVAGALGKRHVTARPRLQTLATAQACSTDPLASSLAPTMAARLRLAWRRVGGAREGPIPVQRWRRLEQRLGKHKVESGLSSCDQNDHREGVYTGESSSVWMGGFFSQPYLEFELDSTDLVWIRLGIKPI
jgi:hypothetical protein